MYAKSEFLAEVSNTKGVTIGLLAGSIWVSPTGPMADNTHKLPENVPGPWYVDDTCTPCRVCLDEAPQLLKYNDDETYVYFFKQPESPEEITAAENASAICPQNSIGNDG